MEGVHGRAFDDVEDGVGNDRRGGGVEEGFAVAGEFGGDGAAEAMAYQDGWGQLRPLEAGL